MSSWLRLLHALCRASSHLTISWQDSTSFPTPWLISGGWKEQFIRDTNSFLLFFGKSLYSTCKTKSYTSNQLHHSPKTALSNHIPSSTKPHCPIAFTKAQNPNHISFEVANTKKPWDWLFSPQFPARWTGTLTVPRAEWVDRAACGRGHGYSS